MAKSPNIVRVLIAGLLAACSIAAAFPMLAETDTEAITESGGMLSGDDEDYDYDASFEGSGDDEDYDYDALFEGSGDDEDYDYDALFEGSGDDEDYVRIDYDADEMYDEDGSTYRSSGDHIDAVIAEAHEWRFHGDGEGAGGQPIASDDDNTVGSASGDWNANDFALIVGFYAVIVILIVMIILAFSAAIWAIHYGFPDTS